MMVQDDSAKARSTVTKEAMDKMPSAANAIDKLKFTPGLNVNSNDASGLSGVDYTMRGMNSDQIGLSMDGIPINDSGNYAVYPNLLGDAENRKRCSSPGALPKRTARTSAPAAATSAR